MTGRRLCRITVRRVSCPNPLWATHVEVMNGGRAEPRFQSSMGPQNDLDTFERSDGRAHGPRQGRVNYRPRAPSANVVTQAVRRSGWGVACPRTATGPGTTLPSWISGLGDCSLQHGGLAQARLRTENHLPRWGPLFDTSTNQAIQRLIMRRERDIGRIRVGMKGWRDRPQCRNHTRFALLGRPSRGPYYPQDRIRWESIFGRNRENTRVGSVLLPRSAA